MSGRLRQRLGVLAKDLPRYLLAFARGGDAYLGIHNRSERLERAPHGPGHRCAWQWTSDLHAARVIPALGSAIARRAFAGHPVAEAAAPPVTDAPEVSFVIGHRGTARLPHLLATLRSIAAQRDVAIECIVVEQDVQSVLTGVLPGWVRHVLTPPPSADMPYCRSWTFNVGARHARGELLVLHDNDMMVPVDYAAALHARIRAGYDVVNPKRFVFYLGAAHTQRVFDGSASLLAEPPEAVTQNLEGGGSVAITRTAYAAIGGMDESFVGWGGEDNEFWERAQTLRMWPYAWLPLWHLWHAAQPGKASTENATLQRARRLSAIPAAERIAALNALPRGALAGPAGWPAARTEPVP
jgi:hypothetical protein